MVGLLEEEKEEAFVVAVVFVVERLATAEEEVVVVELSGPLTSTTSISLSSLLPSSKMEMTYLRDIKGISTVELT